MTAGPQSVFQTREELLEQLQENMTWLRNAVALFDAGDLSQAKLMAGHVRTLLRDGKGRSTSKSILTQLKFGPNMGMISTARKVHDGVILGAQARLCVIRLTPQGGSWMALSQASDFAHRAKVVFLQDWWTEIVVDAPGVTMQRHDIVGMLADKLGAVHSDEKINTAYAHLVRNNPIEVEVKTDEGEFMRLPKVELFTMRQIAHEVLISIERKLSKG